MHETLDHIKLAGLKDLATSVTMLYIISLHKHPEELDKLTKMIISGCSRDDFAMAAAADFNTVITADMNPVVATMVSEMFQYLDLDIVSAELMIHLRDKRVSPQ
ncbi:hypothetical protein HNP86_002015 [Methanococcus maripaludis]|uniref:Uncharacterized protein n=1 Tax=Methanococcus maripaludis TaxID=39152 RepID=A0A7J9P1E2_METMI|nr:hypothetical protein [Methanococcus maripaludis]MBA2851856.1 hypothetical protein [Methanococcus maripaludis]